MTDRAYEFLVAVGLWFAMGTYLNMQLSAVHKKIDRLLDGLHGLKQYLYEIDPQFDDERATDREFAEGRDMFAGIWDMELIRSKEKAGFRTLGSGFFDGSFRSPRDRKETELDE
jgi:hypothetical protein